MTKQDAMRAAVEALDGLLWYVGALETLVYDQDDKGEHDQVTAAKSALSLLRAALEEGEDAEFCIEGAGGMFLASAEGRRGEAWREIQHYAAQYADEGPLTIYEVTRTPVAADKDAK